MNKVQEFTPKYWVVHDKTTDDVYISTAGKSRQASIEAFLDNHSFDRWDKCIRDNELLDYFLEDEHLEVVLVEIKMVQEGK